MKTDLLYDALNRALEEELGLVIETNNAQRLSISLHDAKKPHPAYAAIEICIGSNPNEIFLVKKSVELDEPIYPTEGDLPDV